MREICKDSIISLDCDEKPTGLYIRNVPINFTQAELESLITPYAELLTLNIGKPNDVSLKIGKVYALAKVSSPKEALVVIEKVGGKPPYFLRIELSRNQEEIKKEKFKNNTGNSPLSPTMKTVRTENTSYSLSNVQAALQSELSKKAAETKIIEEPVSVMGMLQEDLISRVIPEISQDTMPCVRCKKPGMNLCSICKATYCSKICQENDWFNTHQFRCKQPPLLIQRENNFKIGQKSSPVVARNCVSKSTTSLGVDVVDKCVMHHEDKLISDHKNIISSDIPVTVDYKHLAEGIRKASLQIKNVHINEPSNDIIEEQSSNGFRNIDKMKKSSMSLDLPKSPLQNFPNIVSFDIKSLTTKISKPLDKKDNDDVSNSKDNAVTSEVKNNELPFKQSLKTESVQLNQNINEVPDESKDAKPKKPSTIKVPVSKSTEETALSKLKIEAVYDAIITEKESLLNFSVTLHNEETAFAMETTLCSDNLSSGSKIRPKYLKVNDIVAAQSPTDGVWYRAKIICILEEKVRVLYIDFGNIEEVQSIRILLENTETSVVPGLALRATLYDDPSTIDKERFNCLQENGFARFCVMAKKSTSTKVAFISDTDEQLATYILKPWQIYDCNKLVTENKIEQTPIVQNDCNALNNSCSSPTKEMEVSTSNSEMSSYNKQNKFFANQLKHQTIEVDKIYLCVLTWYSEELKSVYLQLATKETSALLKHALKQTKIHCKEAELATNLEKKELVCAYVEADNYWYRAKVIDLDKGKAYVHFIDFGNADWVEDKHLKSFGIHLLSTPVLCHEVKAIGFEGNPYVDEIMSTYMTESSFCNMRVKSLDPLTASFTDANTLKDIFLIKEKEKTKKVKIIEAPKSVTTEKTKEKTAVELLKEGTYKPKIIMYDDCSVIELPIKNKIKVFVLKSKDPLNLFVTPLNDTNVFDELEILAENINKYCNSIKSTYYEPVLGEVCLAKFEEDGHWYRAACIEVNRKSAFVSFTDYGDLQSVKFNCLVQMVDKFLTLPHIAVHCIIKGATVENIDAGGDSLVKKFQTAVPGDSVQEINVFSYDKTHSVYVVGTETFNESNLSSK